MPKSPLDKPASGHSRRPSGPRRTSSSEKKSTHSTSSTKHGIKESFGHASTKKSPVTMSTTSTSAKTADTGGSNFLDSEDTRNNEMATVDDATPEQDAGNGRTSRGGAPAAASLSGMGDQAEAVDRLREAVNSQLRLSQQRERLARHLNERDTPTMQKPSPGGKSRVSPIHEETMSPSLDAAFASPLVSGQETASTESTKTLRGGLTPAEASARTPSYPFPSMKTPRQISFTGHKPFTALSPTVIPSNYPGGFFDGGHDQVLSGSITPASTMTFQPADVYQQKEDPNFPSPNLYEMSLMLSAEPGLDPWWTTVCQIMRDLYKADRVTLSVPADSTDVENVPWGQKATYNVMEEDEASLTYLPRGSSLVPSSVDTNETSASEGTNAADEHASLFPGFQESMRPSLQSRHSFTAYEDTKKTPLSRSEANKSNTSRRGPLSRSKSYLSVPPDQAPRIGTLQNAELNLQSLEEHLANEGAQRPAEWEHSDPSARDTQGRVFPVLQALDYEADALLDSSGVTRVLERGKVIALTRDYPYLDPQDGDSASGNKGSQQLSKPNKDVIDKPKRPKKSEKPEKPELKSRLSSFIGAGKSSRSSRSQASDKSKISRSRHDDEDDAQPMRTPRYEEYEQTPPSPWSQSPAPSPAIRADPNYNPFFANAEVDEESFNPSPAQQDYSSMLPVETIGVDRSCTVLHIPLTHVLLSKPIQSFRLDTAAMELRAQGQQSTTAGNSKLPEKEKRTPIAILSIISPVIPYPSNLRHSLEHLAPHLATSFSLCRHFTNLETEIAGLSRKRPQVSGFGAVAPDGRHNQDYRKSRLYSPVEEHAPQHSMTDSITSPSDYSGVSRSAAGSPSETLGGDPGSVGVERRLAMESPGYGVGDSYFTSKSRPGVRRVDTGSGASVTGARRSSKDNSPSEMRQIQRIHVEEPQAIEQGGAVSNDQNENVDNSKLEHMPGTEDPSPVSSEKKQVRIDRLPRDLTFESSEARDTSPLRPGDLPLSPRRQTIRGASTLTSGRTHTQLHSYGADFASTFQSLPTTSATSGKIATGPLPPSRTVSLSLGPTDMPPPSDRLKTLMIDTLPAHLFVALPQTGEIVWVNSRYLTYRGQTVAELYQDPWGSIHPDEREEYLKSWSHAVRTGEQFSMQVRIRRFDGNYRWFYTRAVGGRDTRGVIVQWYGSYMDIHDQHIAEVKAARQEEIEASEAKHRLLANLIPQIIFAATEDEGVTFANEQWLSYTGQDFDDSLGIGFMDFVHPEDLAKCRIPTSRPPTPTTKKPRQATRQGSQSSSTGLSSSTSGKSSNVSEALTETTLKGIHRALSRNNSSSSESFYELPSADLNELARSGVIKVTTDSNGRLSYTTEVRLRSKSGEYRWHLVRCVEVDGINFGSGDGSWFGACTDINDHKLLETKLKEAMESKGKFLSNMSHEIRTPLIGISGMVSFLQDTVLNEEQMDYTNTIQTSANSLLMIINDILDLSKVDAGMMKLSYEWFHPRSLIEDVNELVSTMAISKRIELNYVVEEDVPPMVKGDKVRIRQVLLNVIGNAIKFTSEGEVFSRCRVFRDDSSILSDGEIMLEYSIVDTGRGFTKEEADLIFKPFSQIDGSSTRQHGGSGLGLVISRQLVELHGGHMDGTAVPGKGSTFTFTAKFGLPNELDHPDPPATPSFNKPSTIRSSSISQEISARAMKSAGGIPVLPSRLMQSSGPTSPRTDTDIDSPAVLSSASSDPSVRSFRTHLTDRSSASSVNPSLHHFSEAARASSQDLSMKLAIPESRSPDETTPTPGAMLPSRTSSGSSLLEIQNFRPPMYSILIICPQTHSREATTKHIEMTLPKDIPHQITPSASVLESQKLIGGDDPVIFTHIVLNLTSPEEIVALVDQIFASASLPRTSVVILSDPVQRQAVMKLAIDYDFDQLAKDNRVTFVYKPVKPSRFAVIFDPDKERDLSTDRNRSSAQQQVANQKQNYLDVEKRLGNKGHKVLLVEDNLVNQKVLLKYLSKVGIDVDMALDGIECTDKVFAHPHGHYSLILCDLHMPRKDGYQTCRDIRQWEAKNKLPRMPIIALSANVMADVLDKCIAAGFNSYVTKPVDFKALSTAMSNLLDPTDTTKPHELLRIQS